MLGLMKLNHPFYSIKPFSRWLNLRPGYLIGSNLIKTFTRIELLFDEVSQCLLLCILRSGDVYVLVIEISLNDIITFDQIKFCVQYHIR